ncbi:MAG: penicillin-binding protein 2 [Fusobacterium sp.]|nr:penicillin-binding protein 2 [Fusobacterium sp.]
MKFRREKEQVKLGERRKDREILFKIIILACFGILMVRLAYLQLLKGSEFVQLSEKNQFKIVRIDSPRGKIYDTKGRIIVSNGTGYRLVYLEGREQNEEYIKKIAELIDRDEEYVSRRIKNAEIFPYTKENILIEDLDEMHAHKLIEKVDEYPFLEVQIYSKRRYLYDNVASHTLGYVKKISDKEYEVLKDKDYTPRDIIGKSGIEKTYDEILKGKAGYEYIEVNALNKIQRQIDEKKEPVVGKDLYTSIDIELQKYMEEEFEKDGRSGAFIALDPKNGEIKTIVSYPTFSLNLFSSQISTEDWNRISTDPRKILTNKSIAGEYPPGSIFKVISAFSFLENGVNPKEKYMDYNGYYQIGNWKWRAWKVGGHGPTDMKKSLVESANPYYYKYADKIGAGAIINTAREFKLGDKTGIDVPGERKGIIPSPEWKKKRFGQSWYKGDGILLSIGQGYTLVTPIQMAKAYSFFANRGWAYDPHVVSEIVDAYSGNREKVKVNLETLKEYPNSFYETINDALVATVSQDNGTTKTLRNPHVKVAAKSGSAQNPHSKLTHAWVAGYFPAENPEIVFVCLLEGAGGGGVMAGGMTKKFLDKYLEIEHGILPPNSQENSTIISQN